MNISYHLNHFYYWFLYCWIEHKVGIILGYVLSIILGHFWSNIHNLVMFLQKFLPRRNWNIILFFIQNAWGFNLVIILLSVTTIVFQSIYILTDNDYNVYNVLQTNLVHYTVVVINYTIVAIDSFMMWCGESKQRSISISLFAWWRNVMITRRMDDKLEQLKAYFNTKFKE